MNQEDVSRIVEPLNRPLPELIKQSLGEMRHFRSAGDTAEAVKAARRLLREALGARDGPRKAELEARDVLRENGEI
jgi:hypothetical protein